jgi:hypothetical protein
MLMSDIHLRIHSGPYSIHGAMLLFPDRRIFNPVKEFASIALAIGPLVWTGWKASASLSGVDRKLPLEIYLGCVSR